MRLWEDWDMELMPAGRLLAMEYYENYPGSVVAFNLLFGLAGFAIGLTAAGFVTRPRFVCGSCKQGESGRCMMAPRKKE